MKLWRVTIKQPLKQRRYALHTYGVFAADADTAKLMAVENHRPDWGFTVEAEIETTGVVAGRSSLHREQPLDTYTKGGRQYDR